MKRVICLLLMLVVTLGYADIYKWTDANGDVHFSDKPHPGAETIVLPNTQTYPASTTQTTEEPATKPIANADDKYQKLMITQPEDQITIRNPQGAVTVTINVEPALMDEDKFQLIFDGAPLGPAQTAPVFLLQNINRGSHTLAAAVVDDQGKTLITSEAITLYMQQPRVGMGKNAP